MNGANAARTRPALLAIYIDLVGLAVQGEVHGFVGVSPVNVVGQFDYYRFGHETILTGDNGISEFRERMRANLKL